MHDELERNLGPQPIAEIMERHGLSAHDLVMASEVPMTHKMVARAVKGRRLTRNTQTIVCNALNRAASAAYTLTDLFNYAPRACGADSR
ncbi:MAG: hypothetical protein IJK04_07080 [Kiritimatiellae bacterium]|nr:hypothetical protein [Kiritimatiellia bacterium]